MDNSNSSTNDSGQLRLFAWTGSEDARFRDPLEGWDLVDIRALAIDPDPEIRRVAALSNWNLDVRLQRVLAPDPDEEVVLNLLSRVDPPLEVLHVILAGPHRRARQLLATRNLPTSVLVSLLEDDDVTVRRSAATTLRHRGIADGLEVTSR